MEPNQVRAVARYRGRIADARLVPPFCSFCEGGGQIHWIVPRQQEIQSPGSRVFDPQDDMGHAIDMMDGGRPTR